MGNPLTKLLDQTVFKIEEALKLIALGSDANSENSDGQTLIHLLIGGPNQKFFHKDTPDALTDLVKKYGAGIHKENNKKKTPLQAFMDKKVWATENALLLIELGADPQTQDAKGQTLVHKLACYHPGKIEPHNREAIAKLVTQYNVDINATNAQGKTAFQCFLDQEIIEPKTIEWFLSLGADPNTKNSQNVPLIHLALKNASDIRYLLNNYKVDVNTKNGQDKTPLHHVLDQPLTRNSTECARQLIKFNAEPDTKNTSGDFFLHLLARSSSDVSDVISEQVKTFKAVVTIKNAHDLTPLQTAINAAHNDCHPNNVSALLDLTTEFDEQIKEALKSDDSKELNLLMTKIHANKTFNTFSLQAKIRGIAFEQLKTVVSELAPEEQIEKLQWARKQPLFCMHRSDGFFASIGRTQTVIMIDKMMADNQAISNPEKTCGLF